MGMRIVAVANQKGGAGKTTVTMALAALAAESGSRVLVVDVDPQASATFWATQAGESLPFDVADDTDPANLAQLRRLPYDVVFVDTPGSLADAGVLTTVLAEADFVVLPTEPAPLALQPLFNTIRQLVDPAGVDYRVLINQVDPRAPGDAADCAQLLGQANVQHFRTYARSYKVHSTSPIDGRVVTQYPGDRIALTAASDFTKVYAELVTAWATGSSRKEVAS